MVHWSYDGEGGPEHWGRLSPDFALCDEGVEQSPIDLTGATNAGDVSIERTLGTAVLAPGQRTEVLDIVDNGHTIQVNNDIPMSLEVDGTHYELVQYHFHAPSEHTEDGRHAPLEVHFVHSSEAGELAVLGVLIDEGEANPIWDPILASLPSAEGETRRLEGVELDLANLRPLPDRYYRYRGSLTTPPCTEGVQWIVAAEPHTLSSEQLAKLVPLLENNNRPVQPLRGRELALVSRQ